MIWYNIYMKTEELNIIELKELKESLKDLTDTRVKGKTTYKVWDVVTSSLLAIMANADTFEEIKAFADEKYKFLKSFLQMTGGVASSQTYKNIIGMLSPKELQNISFSFISKMIHGDVKQDIISIDGKVDTSSKREDDKPLNILNAYSSELGIFLHGVRVDDKTNEIPMFKDIIKRINVKGNIITVDALNTQKDNATLVKKLKGEYVFVLKGNHGLIYEDLVDYFNDSELCSSSRKFTQTSKENGNIVVREYFQTNDIDWLEMKDDWTGLKTIGCIKKTITNIKTNKTTTEIRYYISSLEVDVELFAKCIRNHWAVENKLHWQLDFTFKCDDNTTSDKNALENLQILKKIILNLLNLVKANYKKSLIKLRFYICLNVEKYILEIFSLVEKRKKEVGFSLADALKIPIDT